MVSEFARYDLEVDAHTGELTAKSLDAIPIQRFKDKLSTFIKANKLSTVIDLEDA